jgi:hypothetical protein
MRIWTPLVTVILFLTLCAPTLAEKNWKSDPDRLSFSTSDDFAKQTPKQVPGTTIELFSAKKNIQLMLTESGVPSSDPKGSKPPQPVSAAQMIKAFPVLAAEKKLTVHGDPVKLKVDGNDAVLYELETETAPGYQTVYAYVGRGNKPYALILNYANPRDPAKVKVMRTVLQSIDHF